MVPQSQQRRKKNSSKVNLLISFTFHAALVLVLLYFAARSGLIGNSMKKIAISIVKIHKPPVKPKPPPPPKIEPPKVTPKIVQAPKLAMRAPPPAAPVAAPPAQVIPSFGFSDGKTFDTSSDPIEIYKGQLQYAFQSKWDRPENMDDEKYVDEVQVSVSRDGQVSNPQWEKSSGNSIWDESVRKAIEAVTSLGRPPPTNFPQTVVIRFDVQEQSESLLQ